MSFNEWITYSFHELTINLDKTRKPLSSREREKMKGKYPYYGAQGIIDNINRYIFDGTYMLIAEDGENLKSKKQNIAQLAHGQFWVNNHAHIVSNNNLTDIRYLCYLFNNTDVSGYITGSVQPKLSQANLNSIKFTIPPLPYQKKVADTLYCLDKKIETNKHIIRNLEEITQAVYKSWFIDFEPFIDGEFKESELGVIPEKWITVEIGEVIKELKDKVKSQEIPVLSAVRTGNLTLSEEYFNKQVFSKSISKYIMVNPYDFAYNPARINIGSIGMNEFDYPGCVSPVYVAFKSDPGYKWFMKMLFKTERFNVEVNTRASGSVRQTLNFNDFSKIKIVYPTLDVIKQFNILYESFYKVKSGIETELNTLTAIRDSLLPKLLNGEIRVPVEEVQ